MLPQLAQGSANKVFVIPSEFSQAFAKFGDALGGPVAAAARRPARASRRARTARWASPGRGSSADGRHPRRHRRAGGRGRRGGGAGRRRRGARGVPGEHAGVPADVARARAGEQDDGTAFARARAGERDDGTGVRRAGGRSRPPERRAVSGGRRAPPDRRGAGGRARGRRAVSGGGARRTVVRWSARRPAGGRGRGASGGQRELLVLAPAEDRLAHADGQVGLALVGVEPLGAQAQESWSGRPARSPDPPACGGRRGRSRRRSRRGPPRRGCGR